MDDLKATLERLDDAWRHSHHLLFNEMIAAWPLLRRCAAAWVKAESAAAWSAAWKKIAAKSIDIFKAAPVPGSQSGVSPLIQQELCCRRLWCPEGELVGAVEERAT